MLSVLVAFISAEIELVAAQALRQCEQFFAAAVAK